MHPVRLDRLYPLRSAFHDARDAPKPCQSGVRDEIISRIFAWANSSDTSVSWMCCDTSAASSAVAQSIAMRAREEGRLLASYLYPWARNDERQDPVNLIPTIIYQMALFDKDYLRRITTAINMDIDIRYRDGISQISVLLKQPFLDYVAPPGPSMLVVIGALDACDNLADPEITRDLCLFIRTLAFMNWRVKVFITSRYTPDIRQLLESPNFPRFYSFALDHESCLSQADNIVKAVHQGMGTHEVTNPILHRLPQPAVSLPTLGVFL